MITIMQTCDSCGNERCLTRTEQKSTKGWREVSKNVHICTDCINSLLTSKN